MKLPYRILALDDDENALSGIVEMLRDAGYTATGTMTYEAAKRMLGLASFDLLVTDVRLRGFNGLHLVRQSRQDWPEMATMIITGYDEPMIEVEAGRYGAEVMRKPLKSAEFLLSVERCLGAVHRQRRWPRKQVAGGFRIIANGHAAAVMDVCYDGLRLEVEDGGDLPSSFDIEIEGIGLQLPVESVWCQRFEERGGVMYGATLAHDTTPAARTWRTIVDRLSA
jgi:DNA-binding response OmpR family regulator